VRKKQEARSKKQEDSPEMVIFLASEGKAWRMKPTVTVIIAVYNAVRYLDLVLSGFCRQSFSGFEVIIADDGSGPDVQSFIEAFALRSPFLVKHLYQPDEGFRKNQILNRAIQEASSGYLIFVDGDCLPHRHFVRAHWEQRKPYTVLCGRRVMLSQQFSSRLTRQDVLDGTYGRLAFYAIVDALLGRGRHWDEAIRLNNRFLRGLLHRKEPTLLGSNFSLDKTLIEQVNGFNEDYIGAGVGEDTDLEYRLRLLGAQFRSVRHLAIQYHLYHPRVCRHRENVAIFERTKTEGTPVCRNGLRRL
jgi:glycosyltransferase involved in cell wall biosynthesis